MGHYLRLVHLYLAVGLSDEEQVLLRRVEEGRGG
jgi:hypothetical protein